MLFDFGATQKVFEEMGPGDFERLMGARDPCPVAVTLRTIALQVTENTHNDIFDIFLVQLKKVKAGATEEGPLQYVSVVE